MTERAGILGLYQGYTSTSKYSDRAISLFEELCALPLASGMERHGEDCAGGAGERACGEQGSGTSK